MRILRRLRRRSSAFTHDLLMIPLAWLGAFWLRFNLETIPEPYLTEALATMPVVVLVHAVSFWQFGLYRGVWRFASLSDLVRILKAVLFGTAFSAVVIFLWTRMVDLPRSVFPLFALLMITMLGGPRLVYRLAKDHALGAEAGKLVLIVGAGHAGEMLVRNLLREPQGSYAPVAFVDDDPEKRGTDIHGVPVVGGIEDIPAVVQGHGIELIIIAIPSANSKEMQRVVSLCVAAGVPYRTLPRLEEFLTGRASVQDFREISIDDLVGREQVSLDLESVHHWLEGKVVLVTGGGGSIGSELCRQIVQHQPKTLVIFESSEYNLYEIELELQRNSPGAAVVPWLGNVCDTASVGAVMERYRPDVVLHAAAYKHVPMLETNAREAVLNNVLGTKVMAEAAVRLGVETFVLISTDKAVNPVNVMGRSKRLAEMICQQINEKAKTHFVIVRFGNVLNSAGSVVPLFRRQIAAGGPVTVTDPQITRYFMTIAEACQLILQSGCIGRGGEIFVLEMGEPVRIDQLARYMIRLNGKTPDTDIAIDYTGLRPGEKLHEELFHDRESLSPTSHDKILLAQSHRLNLAGLTGALESLRQACLDYRQADVAAILESVIAEAEQEEKESAAGKPSVNER